MEGGSAAYFALYQWDSPDGLSRVLADGTLQGLVDEFSRVWGPHATRSRTLAVVLQETMRG